jgi:hypothetical protein
MKKPLTEVLTGIYVLELARLRGESDWETAWDTLSNEGRARYMGAMASVVEALHAFGLEVVVRAGPGNSFELRSIKDKTPVTRDSLVTSLTTFRDGAAVDKAQAMGFTGICCENCGSPNTVRNGKCLTCMDCKFSGECG